MDKKLLELIIGDLVVDYETNELGIFGKTVLVEFHNSQKLYNLNELASMCKQIFIHYGKGYCLMSFIDFDGTWFANVSGNIHMKSFQGESEHEVVFKAAQWCIDIENQNDKIEKDAELE